MVTRYIDMADPHVRERHPEYAQQVDVNRWSLPLVAIDGKVWFSGYIDHRAIVGVIERKRASA